MDEKTEKFIKQFLNYANLYSATGWSFYKDGVWLIYQSKPHQFRVLKTELNSKTEPHFRVMLNLNHKDLSWIDDNPKLLEIIDDTRYLKDLVKVDRIDKNIYRYLKQEKKWLSKSEYSFFKGVCCNKSVWVVKFRHKKLPFRGLWILGLERDYA